MGGPTVHCTGVHCTVYSVQVYSGQYSQSWRGPKCNPENNPLYFGPPKPLKPFANDSRGYGGPN